MMTDDYQELKMLASAALSGFARGTQDRTQTALGTTITDSVSNGVREGAGEVFELYAKRTLKDVEDNGYFVRVAAGRSSMFMCSNRWIRTRPESPESRSRLSLCMRNLRKTLDCGEDQSCDTVQC